jgi:hypothetical protein
MGIKNEEFYADFKFVDASFKKCSYKSFRQKTMRIISSTTFTRF